MFLWRVLASGVVLVGSVLVVAQQPAAKSPANAAKPWLNAKLSPDERADMVVRAMTQAEKIQLVHGIGWGPLRPNTTIPAGNNGGAGEVLGIPRLGIPDLNQADSAVGVRMAA